MAILKGPLLSVFQAIQLLKPYELKNLSLALGQEYVSPYHWDKRWLNSKDIAEGLKNVLDVGDGSDQVVGEHQQIEIVLQGWLFFGFLALAWVALLLVFIVKLGLRLGLASFQVWQTLLFGGVPPVVLVNQELGKGVYENEDQSEEHTLYVQIEVLGPMSVYLLNMELVLDLREFVLVYTLSFVNELVCFQRKLGHP